MARSSTHHSHTRHCPWILVSFLTYCIHSFWLEHTDLPPVLLHMFERPFTHFLGTTTPHHSHFTRQCPLLRGSCETSHICTVFVLWTSYLCYTHSSTATRIYQGSGVGRYKFRRCKWGSEPDHLLHVILELWLKQVNTSTRWQWSLTKAWKPFNDDGLYY